MTPTWYDAQHRDGLVELVQSVAATQGAVGWLTVPPPEEVDDWIATVVGGGHPFAVATDGQRVLACGILRRQAAPVLKGVAEIVKVMTHRDHRRTGAGRAVLVLLLERARATGVEIVTLDCRGNNHGAQRLYASLGFEVTGRRPDAIGVGDERFDQVLMHLDLRHGPGGLVRHGSRKEGPGST